MYYICIVIMFLKSPYLLGIQYGIYRYNDTKSRFALKYPSTIQFKNKLKNQRNIRKINEI